MTMFTSQHFGGRFVIWVGQTDIFQREIARLPEKPLTGNFQKYSTLIYSLNHSHILAKQIQCLQK